MVRLAGGGVRGGRGGVLGEAVRGRAIGVVQMINSDRAGPEVGVGLA